MRVSLLKTTFKLIVLFGIFFLSGCEKDNDAVDGGSSSLTGVWVRIVDSSGDETDIAIGGISGEPSNRVYMCEWKGNVGLYKGYINGNTITWDSQYGLPNASAKKVGAKLEFYYPSVSNSLPTYYDSGSWSRHCGTLSISGAGSGSNSKTGNAMFWISSDLGCGHITVTVNGQSKTISSYYNSSTPSCGASGCANFTLSPGTYNFSASCDNKTWNSSITVEEGGCQKMRLISN